MIILKAFYRNWYCCQFTIEGFYALAAWFVVIDGRLADNIGKWTGWGMIKENSRKWKSDDCKVMNWDYHNQDDYYIDPKDVRFVFKTYRQGTDKYGFIREFKEYVAEKCGENHHLISAALTPKENLRRI